MKAEWQLSMAVTLILLFVSSVIGCGQSYTPEDLETAREAGYSEGYASGKTEGYTEGHDKGLDTGENVGYELGKTHGYESGYNEGYDIGQSEGYETGISEGYDIGYAEGYDTGIIELEPVIQEAEKLGYNKGYEAGIVAAQQEAQAAAEAEREAAMTRIEDLAYIKASLLFTYSDDADPEAEGVYLTISFYDSKSAPIYVSDVPITVSFNIYNVSGETSRPTKGYDPLIYQDTVFINSTMESIKIPFDKLYGPYYKPPIKNTVTYVVKWLEVTVTTPNQEDFSVTCKSGWFQ